MVRGQLSGYLGVKCWHPGMSQMNITVKDEYEPYFTQNEYEPNRNVL